MTTPLAGVLRVLGLVLLGAVALRLAVWVVWPAVGPLLGLAVLVAAFRLALSGSQPRRRRW